MKLNIGIDIGGTKIKAGLISESGKLTKNISIDTEADKGKKKVLENINKAIDKLINKDVTGIGVGCAGFIDSKKGIIIGSPNIICLKEIKLKKILEKKYKCTVEIDNDANCFTLAEANPLKEKNVIGITLGSGVGGGIVIDKKIYYGCGNAGEIGHTIIDIKEMLEAEDYLSKKWFEKHGKTPKEFFELAEKKDNTAITLFEEYGKNLGILIVNTINTFDPNSIILGGKISNSWKHFNKTMFAEIKKRTYFNNTKITKSKLGDYAGVIGAGLLVKDK